MFGHKIHVLFVCKANICRSPLAEGMLRHRLGELGWQRRVDVRSAGTFASPGHYPDARARRIAAEAGIKLGKIKSSQISVKDILRSDHVLAMDQSVLEDLRAICPEQEQGRLSLLMRYAREVADTDVPDPYYGTYDGFEQVYLLIEEALSGLLTEALAPQ